MEERTSRCLGDPQVTASHPIRWAGRGDDCPARQVFDRVGDRWSMYVLAHLEAGPLRFNEIRRRIKGLSQRILTVTLRSLARDGQITRTQYPTIPPQVDYRITPLGHSLLQAASTLVAWAEAHQGEIQTHREAYDGHGQLVDRGDGINP